ncbi:MAG: hypothetical protein MHM6MM_001939 [Cercozoa sp. M6MM]
MVRKKVDSRVRMLVENGVLLKQRSLFVMVGDKAKEQVPNLWYMLSRASADKRPNGVLWCYDKDLGFSSHRKKRARQIKKDVRRGLREADENDPFELFVTATDIRYMYYKDSHKALGQTFSMLVLQDFEALTPNLLARTVETVEGGGIILVMLKTMSSLKQLYKMTMNVHSRYRTEAHKDVVARFNERFLLSLGDAQRSLVVDDELNVLPISRHAKKMHKVTRDEASAIASENQAELQTVQREMADTPPCGSLLQLCRTVDQAKVLLTCIEALQNTNASAQVQSRATVSVTAARGRGKSAAMGLALAAAVAHDYANVFVTAPSADNLGTLFAFLVKGLRHLGYVEHADFEVVQSTEGDVLNVLRVNVYKDGRRQSVSYVAPRDYLRLASAELLVVDEAAAIPLPVVRRLLGPFAVFLASTVNGYEGTGRALSLKLMAELRQSQRGTQRLTKRVDTSTGAMTTLAANRYNPMESSDAGARTLREVSMQAPIRYGEGDGVERWLTSLLCLDCTGKEHRLLGGLPHPQECSLFSVSRDTLFSFHAASERFLQRVTSLMVASHYKNQPNDLQLLSDAPAHRLFVLLGPLHKLKKGEMPDVLCVVQMCLEGAISSDSAKVDLEQGVRRAGDMIPWTLSQQFLDADFAQLSGARIVRVAVHPDVQGRGYGTRALTQLREHLEGRLLDGALDTAAMRRLYLSRGVDTSGSVSGDSAGSEESLHSERLMPRKDLPPLLTPLSKETPPPLHYLGVSFGLTRQLLKFWRRAGFRAVYVRQTANDLTGEHSCIMLRTLDTDKWVGDVTGVLPDEHWLDALHGDFKRRLVSLLGGAFRDLSSSLAMSLLSPEPRLLTSTCTKDSEKEQVQQQSDILEADRTDPITSLRQLTYHLSLRDVARLEAYSRHQVDYHMVLDVVPIVAQLFFRGRCDFALSVTQAVILLGVALQRRSVDDVATLLNKSNSSGSKKTRAQLTGQQVLALFQRSIAKFSKWARALEEEAARAELPELQQQQHGSIKLRAVKSLDEELEAAADDVQLAEVIGGARHIPSTLSLKRSKPDTADAEADAAEDKTPHEQDEVQQPARKKRNTNKQHKKAGGNKKSKKKRSRTKK